MKINCLSCGHTIDLGNAYDDGYEGPIRCATCRAVLEIKTQEGWVRSQKIVSTEPRSPAPGME